MTEFDDREALDLEIWRLALAELAYSNGRGVFAGPYYSVETYLRAHPRLREWAAEQIKAGTAREAALIVQEKRLALVARNCNKAGEAAPTKETEDWLAPFRAPGATVRLAEIHAGETNVATPAPQENKAPPQRRGRKPAQMVRVLSEMRKTPCADLERMKEETMAMTFGASRDLCRKARDKLLSEIVGN